MTLPATPRLAGPFTGNGVATSFPFTFKVFADTDLRVIKTSVTGVESTLALFADYTVGLNADQSASPGGAVSYPSLATGELLVIVGNVAYNQPLDLPAVGNFNPTAIEDALDRLVMQIQQLKEITDRAALVPVGSSAASADLVSAILALSELSDTLTVIASYAASSTGNVTQFSGNGSQTVFTLPGDPLGKNNTQIFIGGVYQQKGQYSVSGATITFTSAPAAGTNNIEVVWPKTFAVGQTSAALVSNTPAGGLSATTVQAALNELDTEKLAYSAMLAGVAAGTTAASYRNKVINSNFVVNVRNYVSGAAVGVLLYGHDRWKMAASGDSYTYSAVANKTAVTIPSGKVLRQVVAGVNLQSGTYTLSWEGTAQGKIGVGSYGASGITGVVVGGTDTTLEFGPGTLANVQFEVGPVATLYEQRPYDDEVRACWPYAPWWDADAGGKYFGTGQCVGTTTAQILLPILAPARVPPTGIFGIGAGYFVTNAGGSAVAVTVLSFGNSSKTCLALTATVASGLVAGNTTLLNSNGITRIVATGCEL